MPAITKAIPQFGRFYLNRKEQERQLKNQLGLELLKTEMWKRRLQQEAEQQEAQRQMLREFEKEKTQREMLEQQQRTIEHEAEMGLRRKELGLRERQFQEESAFREKQLGLKKEEMEAKDREREKPYHLTEKGTELTLKYMDRAEKFSKDYQTVQNNLMNIVGAVDRLEQMPDSEENRLAVHQAVITSFNKITDPTSVVRESEYKRTPQGASLFNRFKAAYEKINKGGVLTTEDIRELKNTAIAMAEVRRNILNKKLETQIRQPAFKRGLDPEEVAPLYKSVGEMQPKKLKPEIKKDYTDEDINKHLERILK